MGKTRRNKVRILTRNELPDMRCNCGEKAEWVCSICLYDGNAWFCDKCAREHECGEDMLLPVVNSPRCGVCAYEGEIRMRDKNDKS